MTRMRKWIFWTLGLIVFTGALRHRWSGDSQFPEAPESEHVDWSGG